MSTKTVKDTLGITKALLAILSSGGILRECAFNAAYTHQKHYRRDDFERILADIDATPVAHELTEDYRPLLNVNKWGGTSAALVYESIRAGRVRSLRTSHGVGLGALYVSRKDVVPHCPSDGISASTVCAVLGTAKRAVDELVKHGFLSAKLTITPLRRRPVFHIDRRQVDHFAQNHVSMHSVCKEHRLNGSILLPALEIAGIKPIYPASGKGVPRFYKRADIENFFKGTDISTLAGRRARQTIRLNRSSK